MATDISAVRGVRGFIAACLVDAESGAVLASEDSGAGFDLAAAGAAHAEMLRAQIATMRALGLKEPIDAVELAFSGQYHLIQPLSAPEAKFILVALDRKSANLGMARLALKKIEEAVTL